MKLELNLYWVGFKSRVPEKVYCNDITEVYNQYVERFGKQQTLKAIKENSFDGYISFFVEGESEDEAVEYVIENFSKESHLQLV